VGQDLAFRQNCGGRIARVTTHAIPTVARRPKKA
jgi:hypothetical protein